MNGRMENEGPTNSSGVGKQGALSSDSLDLYPGSVTCGLCGLESINFSRVSLKGKIIVSPIRILMRIK